MEFTYIIPFKYSDDRLETLKKVLSNIRDFGCDIIIIEQGTESILPTKDILKNEKYIFSCLYVFGVLLQIHFIINNHSYLFPSSSASTTKNDAWAKRPYL